MAIILFEKNHHKGYKIELQQTITRENLKALMTLFYQKTLEDESLAPFFVVELGDDINNAEWKEHIELLADFWLAHLLGEKTYGGNFVGAHLNVPYIKKESFTQWMRLFSTSLDELYQPKIALMFKEEGRLLSQRFIAELGL